MIDRNRTARPVPQAKRRDQQAEQDRRSAHISDSKRAIAEIGESCAIFFDPNDDLAMQEALSRITREGSPVEAARQRAAEFSWEKAALETIDYLSKSSS